MSYILSAQQFEVTPENFENQDEIEVCLDVQAVNRIVVWGQIRECEAPNEPIEGAIVKAFFVLNPNMENETVYALCHTFSGCDGYYMLSLPQTIIGEDCEGNEVCIDVTNENGVLRIMAVGTSCFPCDPETGEFNDLVPCECPIEPMNSI